MRMSDWSLYYVLYEQWFMVNDCLWKSSFLCKYKLIINLAIELKKYYTENGLNGIYYIYFFFNKLSKFWACNVEMLAHIIIRLTMPSMIYVCNIHIIKCVHCACVWYLNETECVMICFYWYRCSILLLFIISLNMYVRLFKRAEINVRFTLFLAYNYIIIDNMALCIEFRKFLNFTDKSNK